MSRPLFSHQMVFKERPSLPPSGPAGGALTGTYPNPTIAPKSQWIDAIAQDYSIAKNNVAIGHGLNTWANVPCPLGWSIPGKDAWWRYANANMTTRGGLCLFLCFPAMWMFITATAPKQAYARLIIDNTATAWQANYDLSAGLFPWPGAASIYGLPAGTHNFAVDFYAQTGAAWLNPASGTGSPGSFYVLEFL